MLTIIFDLALMKPSILCLTRMTAHASVAAGPVQMTTSHPLSAPAPFPPPRGKSLQGAEPG